MYFMDFIEIDQHKVVQNYEEEYWFIFQKKKS